MTDVTNQAFTNVESHESDETAIELIEILCGVMQRCNLNGNDFDLLLSSAARKYVNELVREQADERSIA